MYVYEHDRGVEKGTLIGAVLKSDYLNQPRPQVALLEGCSIQGQIQKS